MSAMQEMIARAARDPQCIVLSEGEDPRVVAAAIRAREGGLARLILVGDEARIRAQYAALGGAPDEGVALHDPTKGLHISDLATLYYDLRKHKGVDLGQAQEAVKTPHVYAALLVRAGLADGTIGGAVTTTAEIVRTAIQVIGPQPGNKVISSFFLMFFGSHTPIGEKVALFSDCGLVIDPNADEMAQIALSSARSYEALLGSAARVAMLSFSTRGSARHPAVSKVMEATSLAQKLAPDLLIDGEMQFDTALIPEVADKKAPGSLVAGTANVFIFPNLDSGNIGYKIAQRLGGADAIGPVLQGLAQPANDLSRGSSAADIYHMIAVTAVQALNNQAQASSPPGI